MDDFSIKRYQPAYQAEWDAFVAGSRNGTFLFRRDFMDYHRDRFDDYSLMVYDNGKLFAILPAHQQQGVLASHWGLTYGGLVYDEDAKLLGLIHAFRTLLAYLHDNGLHTLRIRMIPSIYFALPSDELLYALFLADARLIRRDSLSVIDLGKPYKISKTRKESIRRGAKNGLEICEDGDFELFWKQILEPNLAAKHQVRPVHSLAEIQALHRKFPDHIRHFNVYHDGRIVAGTTVFVSRFVAHPQYVSGQEDKNALGSLDYLYHHLITHVFADKAFFDFGISNEENGSKLNQGLAFWKESFGARTLAQDFYELPTKNFRLLENVSI